MRPTENIEDLIKSLHDTTSADMDERVLKNSFKALEKSKRIKSAETKPNIWRKIMNSKLTKLAVAAGLIIAVLIGINQFGGSIDVASVALADVIEKIE